MRPVKSTKRSQRKIRRISAPSFTIPIPLRVLFRPDERGTYEMRSVKGERIEVRNTPWTFALREVDAQGNLMERDRSDPAQETFAQPQFEPCGPGDGMDTEFEDPWLLRNEFFSFDAAEGLNGFTLVYGRFGRGSEDLLVPMAKFPDGCHVLECWRALKDEWGDWVSLIKAATRTPIEKWGRLKRRFPARKVELLQKPMPLVVEWQDGRPTGIVSCSGILQAVVATLQIDALIGAEHRFCACEGCRNLFKVKRNDHRYCSDECKHRQVVRNGRSKKSKGGGTKK